MFAPSDIQISIHRYLDHEESDKHDTMETSKLSPSNTKEIKIYIVPGKGLKIIVLKNLIGDKKTKLYNFIIYKKIIIISSTNTELMNKYQKSVVK